VSHRRKTDWINSADQAYIAIAGNTNVLHQSAVMLDGETIVRTRGIMSSQPSVYSADLNVIGAMGMAVVSEQAAVAGAGSIPGPWTNAAWDGWFVHEYYTWNFEFLSSVGVNTPSSVQQVIDSKAMRKVEAGDRLVVMVESEGDAHLVAVNFRMLFKLP